MSWQPQSSPAQVQSWSWKRVGPTVPVSRNSTATHGTLDQLVAPAVASHSFASRAHFAFRFIKTYASSDSSSMLLLNLLSYVTAIVAFLFVTLSLGTPPTQNSHSTQPSVSASGLLWLAEIIEENSRFAKVIGVRAVYVIILLHVALWAFDDLPWRLVAFSIAAHLIYLQNFSANWPLITLTSPSFLLSCIFVVADHFLWFFYFARITQEARQRGRISRGRTSPYRREVQDTWAEPPTFAEIATFFTICVWLVPLYLFLSLSAMDNALPTSSGTASPKPGYQPTPTPQRTSLVKSLMSWIPLSAFQRKRAGHARQRSEGLIAPRTPNRSPMLSPSLGALPQGSWSLNGEDAFVDSNPPPMLTPPPPRRPTTDGLGLGVNGGRGLARVSSTTSLRAGNASPRLVPDIMDSPRGSMDLLDDGSRYGTNGTAIATGPRSRTANRRSLLPEGESGSLGL
ncbi:Transmembrane adaptor Erv26 [Ceratobasidium theobromae]|uniref:Transmembrane adaptor Erv26 n=1 Tax=Ceratobasidium theobromae TaxID=1582974 RepID=A0A5N5QUY4_9AGAM|nr:Transmembrane adaptor Erv26 [Ceratobasidium theobromae]